MRNTPEKRHRLTNYIQRLPFVGIPSDIPESDLETSAILQALKKDQPALYNTINKQTNLTLDDLTPELARDDSGSFIVSEGELLTIVARSLRMGAAVVLSVLGSTADEIQSLEASLTDQPTGNDTT